MPARKLLPAPSGEICWLAGLASLFSAFITHSRDVHQTSIRLLGLFAGKHASHILPRKTGVSFIDLVSPGGWESVYLLTFLVGDETKEIPVG